MVEAPAAAIGFQFIRIPTPVIRSRWEVIDGEEGNVMIVCRQGLAIVTVRAGLPNSVSERVVCFVDAGRQNTIFYKDKVICCRVPLLIVQRESVGAREGKC